jgi:hypothetical protein
MFVIEWIGPHEADGPRVLHREVSETSDLTSVIRRAKSLLKRPVDFPDGRAIGIRVVSEDGLQQWLGLAPDAKLAHMLPSRKAS